MQEGRSLLAQFFKFTSATIASLLVFSLYSIVDGLFVARGIGEYAMSAVNLAVPFINLLFSVAVLFAVGTSTIIAIYLGQGKQENANSLFSQNLALLLAIGLVITAIVLLFPQQFAALLGAKDVTLPYATKYLQGLAPFAVCFMVSYNLEILVKTDGYPQIAIITVVTGCITNCVLDYLMIFVWQWGTWGAAFATGLSQLLTCIIYLIHFTGSKTTFHPVRFRMDWNIYRRLIPIGVSDGVTELCNGLMIFLFNRTILRCIGQDGLVSYTIIAYVNTLIINIMLGVSQGAQPLISYQYGKGNKKNNISLLRYGLITAACVAVVGFSLFYLFAPQLVHAFLGNENPTLNAYSVNAFHRYSLCYLLVGFNIMIGGFMTAVERPKPAIAISIGRGLLVQSCCLLILAAIFGGDSIWLAPVISEAICLVFALIFLGSNHKKKD